jgi:hypothetical protein
MDTPFVASSACCRPAPAKAVNIRVLEPHRQYPRRRTGYHGECTDEDK